MNSQFSNDTRWAHMRAPSVDDLARLARRTWDQVPATLRQMTGEMSILVEEFPDEQTMDEVGCETPFDIMGLLRHGPGSHPELVIYRRAVLDYWVEQNEELSSVLTQVMVQEAAHRLELPDDIITQLETEIEAMSPRPRTVQ